MARLKDRNKFIPNGFEFTQPQLNYQTQGAGYKSFYVVRDEIVTVRRANPFLAQQHHLSTDPDVVANELDAFCTARCQARGWTNFITETNGPPLSNPSQRLRQSGVAAVGSVKKTAAGIGLVRDWIGSGLKPVDKSLAELRAGVCVDCPQNGDPNWIQKLDAVAAEGVKKLLEIRNDLRLETPHDAKLFSCQACDCALRLKVWAPSNHILEHTSPEVKANLDPRCWITAEERAKARILQGDYDH